jgi:hypothetical protein
MMGPAAAAGHVSTSSSETPGLQADSVPAGPGRRRRIESRVRRRLSTGAGRPQTGQQSGSYVKFKLPVGT